MLPSPDLTERKWALLFKLYCAGVEGVPLDYLRQGVRGGFDQQRTIAPLLCSFPPLVERYAAPIPVPGLADVVDLRLRITRVGVAYFERYRT